jgi:hypothetical protein
VRVAAATILVESKDESAIELLLAAIQLRDLPVIASLPEYYLPWGSDGDE